jgi:hypothetical protein
MRVELHFVAAAAHPGRRGRSSITKAGTPARAGEGRDVNLRKRIESLEEQTGTSDDEIRTWIDLVQAIYKGERARQLSPELRSLMEAANRSTVDNAENNRAGSDSKTRASPNPARTLHRRTQP